MGNQSILPWYIRKDIQKMLDNFPAVANAMEAILAFVKANQSYAVPILFLAVFAENLAVISLFVPAALLIPAIGAMLGASGADLSPFFYTCWFASWLGFSVSYWFGKAYKHELGGWFSKGYPEAFEKSGVFLQKWGVLAVFLGHFVGPVRGFISIFVGIYAMNQWKFQFWNLLGSLAWSLYVTAPGAFTSGDPLGVLKSLLF